jgi:chemotaxis protein MotB
MSRRKRHPEHANHERWLVSYADFITLLFAFFVVLYSSSQVDQRKVGKLALAIQVAFQELGVFPASTSAVPMSGAEPMPFNTVQAIENVEKTASLGQIAPNAKGALSSGSADGNLTDLRRELEKQLAPEIKRQELALRVHGDGLVISLREVGFFDSGSAQVKAASQPAFERIARILLEREYRVRIEGHTDNVPIHTAHFASNWELSTGRATELVRLLIVKYGFDPARLSAAGYAEYHPIAENNTAAGRQLNRRVDVVVLGAQEAATARRAPKSEKDSTDPNPAEKSPPTPGNPAARNPSI